MKRVCHSKWFVQICVLLVLVVLPEWHRLRAESQVIGDIPPEEYEGVTGNPLSHSHLLPHHQQNHNRNHRSNHNQEEHLHHRQHHHRRKHIRRHRQSHYEILHLEEQQQQLGKQWRQWVSHLPSPDYVNDGTMSHDTKHQSQSNSLSPQRVPEPQIYGQFDVEDYQRYANIDLAAPRSGRHRGRHLPLNNNILQSGAALPSGKYLRSLPDSLSFPHDRQYASQPQRHWPVKREAIVEGDVILGGLMMVHSREDSITCGPIMPQGGIQALEAMLFTIDRINREQLLPNITLGAHILDDCDKDSYGLEMAVDFIKGKVFSRTNRL